MHFAQTLFKVVAAALFLLGTSGAVKFHDSKLKMRSDLRSRNGLDGDIIAERRTDGGVAAARHEARQAPFPTNGTGGPEAPRPILVPVQPRHERAAAPTFKRATNETASDSIQRAVRDVVTKQMG